MLGGGAGIDPPSPKAEASTAMVDAPVSISGCACTALWGCGVGARGGCAKGGCGCGAGGCAKGGCGAGGCANEGGGCGATGACGAGGCASGGCARGGCGARGGAAKLGAMPEAGPRSSLNCEGCMTVFDSRSRSSSPPSPPSVEGSIAAMPPTMVFWNCAGTPPAPRGASGDDEVISIVPLNLGAGFGALALGFAVRGAAQRWQAGTLSGF